MGATATQPRGRGRASTAGEPETASVTQLPAPTPAQPEGSQLAAALLAIQTAAGPLARNAEGNVGGRGYKYVNLDALLDEIVPLYQEHQVAFRAMPCRDEHGEPALRYRFTHIPSGEYEEDLYPLLLAKVDPQGMGSAITYARRYVQLAGLNLAPGDDDDGAAAGGPVRTITQPQAATATAGPRRGDGSVPVSAKQKTMIKARARDGHLGSSDLVAILMGATGRTPMTYPPEVAKQKLGMELDRLPASAVDEVLAAIAARAAEIEHEVA